MKKIITWEEFNESYNKPRVGGKKRWSVKYKKTIDCNNPKGFSQKQYCKRKRKGGNYKSVKENFGLSDQEIENKIMEVWKVDPYEFKDYITSSMDHGDLYGSCNLTFVLWYPYPDSNVEPCAIFMLEDNEWKKGPWYDNMDAILKSERYEVGIEAWVPDVGGNHEKIEKFYNYANRVLQEADIPYIASYPDVRHEGKILLEYGYTWGYKTKFIGDE
jgi:hypothetical protein